MRNSPAAHDNDFSEMLSDPVVRDCRLDRFLNMAKPLCLDIPRSKKHVSLIIRKGRLMAVGTNIFKGHPLAKTLGYRFEEQHSELNALLKCQEKDKLILLNARFNKNLEMRMARPCPLCLPWCVGVFQEIYYTCPDGKVRLLDNRPKEDHNLTSLLLAG